MSRKENAVSFLYRHFGESFQDGVMSFKYGGCSYSVSNLKKDSLNYGPHKFSLSLDSEYTCRNFSVKRTLRGPKIVFDLINWSV